MPCAWHSVRAWPAVAANDSMHVLGADRDGCAPAPIESSPQTEMHFAPAPRGLLLQQRTAARVASPSRHPSRLELNAGRAARARGHPRAVLCHCVRAERVSGSIRASPCRVCTAHVEQLRQEVRGVKSVMDSLLLSYLNAQPEPHLLPHAPSLPISSCISSASASSSAEPPPIATWRARSSSSVLAPSAAACRRSPPCLNGQRR